MNKIVIDTDPGIDDAIALLMALSTAELDVHAITVVAGNCNVDQGVRNALGIVELLGAGSVPVARGAERPRSGGPYLRRGFTVHGSNGLGGAVLPVRTVSADPRPGAEVLVDSVKSSPGEVTLVALAPLTNLARAIDIWPGIVSSVRRVIVMGGALAVRGNATEYAECNIFNDPHAADVVFSSGMLIILVPLDVTREATIFEMVFEGMLKEFAGNPVIEFFRTATASYFKYRPQGQGKRSAALHDPLALALSIDPNLVQYEKKRITVNLADGDMLGRTIELNDLDATAGHLVNVASKLNLAQFIHLVIDCMSRAAMKCASRRQ